MSDAIDPTTDINNFYNYYYNIDTAQGVGLDIWGTIVGVSRTLNASPAELYLGFAEGNSIAGQDYQPFGWGTFYTGITGGAYILADNAFRTLIYVKALSNISDGTLYSYNKLLTLLFSQKVYCLEVAPMHIQYVFATPLLPYQVAILTTNSVVPRPAGVIVTLA